MKESLDLLEEKCGPEGTWKSKGHYWTPIDKNYLSVARSLRSREVVDWGRSGPNEIITLNALRVLKSTDNLN